MRIKDKLSAITYAVAKKNSGGGGTTNYNNLSNQPKVNNVTLEGNKTSANLGLMSANYTYENDRLTLNVPQS